MAKTSRVAIMTGMSKRTILAKLARLAKMTRLTKKAR